MCKRIAVVTGTRAEYGLLYWIMKEIQSDPDLELLVMATGMHLSHEFGSTWENIINDGFCIDAKVEMLLSSDSPVAIAKSVGLGTIGFADALERLRPDLMLVLGDRYEILSAVSAALFLRIPVAHMCGGELTEGAFDDSIRHAVTKMSHLHFASTETYKNRIMQMGENPENVFYLGSTGVENIKKIKLMTREELEKSLDMKFSTPLFLATYHPVTLEGSPEKAFSELLSALEKFPEAGIIYTYPNSDTYGRIIIKMMNKYVSSNNQRMKAFVSLGQKRYLSAMNECDVVIGNSSSGIVEAPVFGKPTVNIGDRQKGRLKVSSIIDCAEKKADIERAINQALSPEFHKIAKETELLYCSEEDTSKRVKNILKECDVSNLIKKQFYDKIF